MKKSLFLFLVSLISVSLFSCGNKKTASIVEGLEKDTTDYGSLKDEETKLVRFHYKRKDASEDYGTYLNWNMWSWDAGNKLNGYRYDYKMYDDFGAICDIDLSKVNPSGKVEELGFIVAKLGGSDYSSPTWYGKDIEQDRTVVIDAISKGGIQHVYLIGNKMKVYTTLESTYYSSFSYARLVDTNTISVNIDKVEDKFSLSQKKLIIKIGDKEYSNYSIEDKSTNTSTIYNIKLEDKVDITKAITLEYQFAKNYVDKTTVLLTNYYDSDEFINNYTYIGDDLGVTFDNEDMPTKTIFKVWAPTSSSMKLNIYNSGDYKTDLNPAYTFDMVKGEKGVYYYEYNGDLTNKYYTYTVTNSMGTNEVVDPYAKSAGVNGRRGMIVNFKKINSSIDGWNDDTRVDYGINGTDASIYEIHVRDMTINPNSGVSNANRGKFLGLTETGTTYTENGVTVSTGLDHLKELGITHVQIQPFYDYSSVDESLDNSSMSETNYNWGYDPLNYNVLEGSYSTNPNDGTVRIKEFKQMVMALHKAGINVTMDAVYNHTSSTLDSNFELLVPRYYHRTSAKGDYYNGSGCGNEMASQRAMVRQFMVQSSSFWTEEYHLSGFRFDLMGLMDNQTVIDIYKSVKKIDDKALVYGEPWTGGTTSLVDGINSSNLDRQKTVQNSLAQSYFVGEGNYVGAFNDIIRNGIRGDNSPSSGWIQNGGEAGSGIIDGINGLFNSVNSVEPEQVLNYVSCHDNYTLYDQLKLTLGSAFTNQAYSQAESVIFTSQGVAFMQEGEDFMRSKDYIDKDTQKTTYSHNSYNVGDYINDMDYSLKVKNLDMFKYFKDLIKVRKEVNELTLSSRQEIKERQSVDTTSSHIKITIKGLNNMGDVVVYHASSFENVTLDGTYSVILDNMNLNSGNISSLTLNKNQSVILRKVIA